MKAKTFILILALTLSTLATGASVFFEGEINGYRVLFLDTKYGNRVHVGVQAPTGMALDEPTELAGVSHLLEHQVFRRTKLFEDGEREVKRISRISGGNYNAATGNAITYYFMDGHLDAAEPMIRHIGAMMSDFAPLEEPYLKERSVVMEEAQQYQVRDSIVLDDAPYTELLPPGHYRRKYLIGQQAQLGAVDVDRIQDFYYANYQPSSLTVVVTGNFSAMPRVKVEEIKAVIGAAFHAPKDERPASGRPPVLAGPNVVFPPLIPLGAGPDHERIAEIKANTDLRVLTLLFELPSDSSGRDFDSLEVLQDILTLELPGSFVRNLRERGWIEYAWPSRDVENNLKTNRISFVLKEAGYAHRYEIVTEFFALLGKLHREGIAADVRDLAVQKNISSYNTLNTNPAKLFTLVAENLWRPDMSPNDVLDAQGRFSAVTVERLHGTIARGFSLDKMLAVYLGPEVTSAQSSEVFGREVLKIPSAPKFAAWREAFEGKTEPPLFHPNKGGIEVPVSTRPPRLVEGRVTTDQRDGVSILSRESRLVPGAGVSIRLRFPMLGLEEQAAFSLFLNAFSSRTEAERQIFNLNEIIFDAGGAVHGDIRLLLRGDRESIRAASDWYFKNLATFVPGEDDLSRAIEQLRTNLQAANQGFTATLAVSALTDLRERHRTEAAQRQTVVETLKDPARVMELVRAAFRQADIRVSTVGQITPAYAGTLAAQVRRYFPNPLSAEQREALNGLTLLPSQNLVGWRQSPTEQKPEAVAAIREYGPFQGLSVELASAMALTDLLEEEVFIENRAEKGLGYVHGARSRALSDGSTFLFLFGQASGGIPHLQEMLRGWDDVMGRVERRELNADSLADVKTGVAREVALIPTNVAMEAFEQDLDLERHGRPDGRAQVAKLITGLTMEDLYHTAQRKFRQPSLSVLISRERPPEGTCPEQIADYADLKLPSLPVVN